MKNFVGIDLGTTNSAICSFNGSETRIWKSPEQNDVTPSVIYIDKRGNKYVGKRAYDSAPHSPDNAAMLFKRLMGTSTPVKLSAVDLTKTPEECSAEILKVLFGYLPEEIRKSEDTGIIITVPAAFNQMQKDATLQAANLAGLGKVALMQEPVAAVMSVMRTRSTDGMFLIYDLGGGTLDIAIAESIGGRVNLLAHGGISMCGGRDFDRALVDNIVRPWLLEKFDLPEDFAISPKFKTLMRLAAWASERAKIELSSSENTVINLSETEARVQDLQGEEIYLDINLSREVFDKLIAERVAESIEAARETLSKAGLSSHDLERVVFVGGPTNYKPLRDKVAFELGVPGNTEVNPMIAVAEGASVFAESIDWSSVNRTRKDTKAKISPNQSLPLSFNYTARTPNAKAKVVAQLTSNIESGYEFQIDSSDTGWTSGRIALENGITLDINLTKQGENIFKVFVFDQHGSPLSLSNDKIIITKTAATVDAIPASHSIAIEVLEKIGGSNTLDYLIKSGDLLPKKGKKIFKAAETLKAGSNSSINLKIWEGEIEDPISDNRPIGVLKITGLDFDDGIIPAGAELHCDYEVLDSGNVLIEVSVPAIGSTFHSGKNFYSRQEGQLDYTSSNTYVKEEGERTLQRISEIEEVVRNPKLEQAKQKLESAASIQSSDIDTESSQESMEKILEARRILAQVRKENLKEIRQIDLDNATSFFNEHLKEHAKLSEITSFENLMKTAQRSIDRNDKDFEQHLSELHSKTTGILWRQDWFVALKFRQLAESPHVFADKDEFEILIHDGIQALEKDDTDQLRRVVLSLMQIQIGSLPDSEIFEATNIIRG